MNISTAEAWSLLPERPTPSKWLAYVVLGLIGIVFLAPALAEPAGVARIAQGCLAAFVAGYAFTGAYWTALRLDDAEGER